MRVGGLFAAAACAAMLVAPIASAQDPATPRTDIMGSATGGSAPTFLGAPAERRPLRMRRAIPRHPFMAPNGRSNIHDDGFQSDIYTQAGPLGLSPQVSSTFFARECASVGFDSRGRIVTVCVGLDRPVLAMLDPVTLDTLASMPLPARQSSGGGNPFTDFTGGGYFYLDHEDRAVLATTDRHIYVVAETDGPGFSKVADYDLSAAVPASQKIISALPDWDGRLWFAATGGVVGWVDPDGTVHSTDLEETISNSFAVGPGGAVFIVSDAALYRFEASGDEVETIWRRRYANTGETKSGQTSPGSGTTPTLMNGRWVAITNNADPMAIVVFDRRRKARGRRLICRQPVLGEGTGSTDQSLIGFDRSIITENNLGYAGPASTQGGRTTTAGLERVVVRRKRHRDPNRNCRVAWRSEEIAPSVVPKLSLDAGLVYTYTKPETGGPDDPWYLTALDFRSGETVYKQLAGTGLGFNNNYAPVTLGPDGVAYVGVLGGLVRIADGG